MWWLLGCVVCRGVEPRVRVGRFGLRARAGGRGHARAAVPHASGMRRRRCWRRAVRVDGGLAVGWAHALRSVEVEVEVEGIAIAIELV